MNEKYQKKLEGLKQKNKEEIKNLENQYNNIMIENLDRINNILDQYQNNLRGLFNEI